MVVVASKQKRKQVRKGKKGTLKPKGASKRRKGPRRPRSSKVLVSIVVRKDIGERTAMSTWNH